MVLVILVWSTFHPIFEELYHIWRLLEVPNLGAFSPVDISERKKHALKNKRKELNLNLVLNIVQ